MRAIGNGRKGFAVGSQRTEHFSVRGNASLGHLARIHRRLDRLAVLPIIEAALLDPHEYVRGQANAAADDIEQSLGWALVRPGERG